MATTTMNISLPDALKEFVDSEVASGGYTSASEYIRELVRERKAKKELDQQLLAALESEDLGALPPDFFDKLRQRARARGLDPLPTPSSHAGA
ncbi:MAG TPA: type II toxin-antitoxin system ParD family antitoxin [Candidatus Binatia bacterium]